MLFSERYMPQRIDDILGNDTAKEKIKKWILDWNRNKLRKPILVYGQSGTGKTSFAYALKKEFDLELIELNASQFRNKKNVNNIMANTMMAGTLTGKKKIILIDDVDILQRKDRGGATEISKLIKEANIPIILTGGDPWIKKISAIRMQCELIQLRKISKRTIMKLLRTISQKEELEMMEEQLENIAENANGDVRSAINDLQAAHSVNRDRKKDIFNVIREIFKAEKYTEVKNLMRGDLNLDIVKLWIDENIPYEYSEKKDIARAYNYMSRSDIFQGRIGFENWKLFKYVIDFFSAGVALSKTKKNHSFVKYKFPQYLKDMASSMRRRAMLKSIGLKIGNKTHTNRKTALNYLPLISDKIEKGSIGIKDYFEFTDDEIEFIKKIPLDKIEVKKPRKKREGKKGETNLADFN